MGRNSKKKKRSGSGRKSAGRAASGDHSSRIGDDEDVLSDELTALTAIFQEDIDVVSESHQTQIVINVRPYSNEVGFEEANVSARLVVRCLPGYPNKCPKLQVVPEKGLSKEDAAQLHSLLVDQANINARDGRVMIFNLVEAAQEFLSEITPVTQPVKYAPSSGPCISDLPPLKDPAVACEKNNKVEGASIYGSIDLFGDICGDQVSWGGHGIKVANDNSYALSRKQSSPVERCRSSYIPSQTHTAVNMKNAVESHHFIQNANSNGSHGVKHGAVQQTITKLNALVEEAECDSKGASSDDFDIQLTVESSREGSDNALHEDLNLEEQTTTAGYSSEGKSSNSSSIASVETREEFQRQKKELLMVYLLHIACSSKRSWAHALTEISSELHNLGLLSEWAQELATKSPEVFGKAFGHAFGEHMISSCISQFWNTGANISGDGAFSLPNSRYLNDFEEVHSLGHGGFGHVVLCKNKLDGRHYAVKKIRLKDKSPHVNEKILREVATLSRLQHQHVVRYYQAWIETGAGFYRGDNNYGSRTTESTSYSYMDKSLPNTTGPNDVQESTYLYIQMEYCRRTLRQDFESQNASLDKEYIWHLFRQIVEGLAHIHGQGIIHRDLTPNNIFFDVRNDIKIGDFGLAKFLKLEGLDHDQHLLDETNGVCVDGTGQVGTYFYTAPEIEQRWPQINEKVDMYSLGVVFFELWHPFATAMERHIILSDLKQRGSPPSAWVAEYPDQVALLQRLMSPSPSDRPSAIEILQNALPPRMEDEWLNDMLRTIKTTEDTYVYDRVLSTIFDEERLVLKNQHQSYGSGKMSRDESSFRQFNEYDTELRDNASEVTKEVFRQHGARRLEISPMRVLDGSPPLGRKSVKLLNRGGNMLELCHELRSPFVAWIATKQVSSFKRYEISSVYRRAIGHSTPFRFLQGDFDIIGGTPPLMQAEAIKVALDIATHFLHSEAIRIQLNHGSILEAIWTWVGIQRELRQYVAELLPLITSASPQSAIRKTNWVLVRRQLLQDLNISAAVVDRLQTVDLRFCGSGDQALARLRGALSPDYSIHKALEELSALLSYLRIWRIDKHISVDALMPPPEHYYKGLYFQIYLKENNAGSAYEGTLLALGGSYDHLVHQMWDPKYKFNPPNAVGLSLALEKILLHSSVDIRTFRSEHNIGMLVCSKGGGGLLHERMEIVDELWQANLKAELVPLLDPSLTEQYEYANEHDIKCLIIITEAGLSQTGLVKVRHLELKREKDIERPLLIKFLTESISTQFRSLSNWN